MTLLDVYRLYPCTQNNLFKASNVFRKSNVTSKLVSKSNIHLQPQFFSGFSTVEHVHFYKLKSKKISNILYFQGTVYLKEIYYLKLLCMFDIFVLIRTKNTNETHYYAKHIIG